MMNDTPGTQMKGIQNQSLLSNTYAYSPHLPPLSENSLKQEGTNSNESIERILSSSIQRAKQKITMLEGRQRQQRGDSRQDRAHSKQGNKQGNGAIAAAMKVLQNRVHELEKIVQSSEREKNIILKQLDNLTSEKKSILVDLEETNRKNAQLQISTKGFKTEIKDLNRKLEEAISKYTQYQGKCQGLQMTIRHLQSDKQQMSMSFSRRQQEATSKNSPNHKQIMMKVAEIDQRSKVLHQKQKKIQEKQRKLGMLEIQLKEREAKTSIQNSRIKQLLSENSNLRQQIKTLSEQLNHNNIVDQKQNYQLYEKEIDNMKGQIELLKQTTKIRQRQDQQQKKYTHMQLERTRELQDKYEEILHLYRRSEERGKRDEKQIKILRQRIRQLQDLLSDIIEKVAKLPNSSKDLKYLSVKASKLMSANAQRMITLKTPTKSRSNSLNRSLSRSNSQRKSTHQSHLQNQNSNRSNKIKSGSKSKKKEQSLTKQRNSGSKTKRVLVSQAGQKDTDRDLNDMKKQYKRLVHILNENQTQQIRNQLTELALAIQEKSQKNLKQQKSRPTKTK